MTAPEARLTSCDDLNHLYCCDPDLGLCGTDLTGHPEVDDDAPITCVVCDDLDGRPSACCGHQPATTDGTGA